MIMGLNIALKAAIHASGYRQGFIAKQVGMHETQLSHIIVGRREATDDQKKALADLLHKPVLDLFPATVDA